MRKRGRQAIDLSIDGQRIGCLLTEALATGTALTASLLLKKAPRSGSVFA